MRALGLFLLACLASLGRADADELDDAIRAAEIATLLRQVQDADETDRGNAARVLVRCSEFRPVRDALVHSDPLIREVATEAVCGVERSLRESFGERKLPAEWAEIIREAASVPGPQRRGLLWALRNLAWGDPTMSGFWIGVAQSENARERAAALSWFASLPPTAEEAKAAVSAIDRSPAEALELLAEPTWSPFWADHAGLAAPAREAALRMLGNGDTRTRVAAAVALGRAGCGDAGTIGALTGATRDREWQVREAAWGALADLVDDGAAPPETLARGFARAPDSLLPRLVDAVHGMEPRVVEGLRVAFARGCQGQLAAALALVRAGAPVDRPVIACIASAGPAGAYEDALRSIPGALEVIREATVERAGDTSDFTRGSAIRALGAFPPGQVEADLKRLLQCEDVFVLRDTVETLHRLGIAREETVAALRGRLRARSAVSRIVSCELLLDIGVKDPELARPMVPYLDDPEHACYAAEALGRLGADAAPVAPALLRALASSNVNVHAGVAAALAEIPLADEESYDVLVRAARRNTSLDKRPRHESALCCAVWKAMLGHPLHRTEDLAMLLRETAGRAPDNYLCDLAGVLARHGPRDETLGILLGMLAEPTHRLFAVRLLEWIAPDRPEVADALLALMREGGPEEREGAMSIALRTGLHRDLLATRGVLEAFPSFGHPAPGYWFALDPPADPRIAALCARVLLRATGRQPALDTLRALMAVEAVPHLREIARRCDPASGSEIERTILALSR